MLDTCRNIHFPFLKFVVFSFFFPRKKIKAASQIFEQIKLPKYKVYERHRIWPTELSNNFFSYHRHGTWRSLLFRNPIFKKMTFTPIVTGKGKNSDGGVRENCNNIIFCHFIRYNAMVKIVKGVISQPGAPNFQIENNWCKWSVLSQKLSFMRFLLVTSGIMILKKNYKNTICF